MPRLDWISQHDPRSRAYGVRAILPTRAPRSHVLWRPGLQLDQGQEGACVGFAWAADTLASPVRVTLADTNYATYWTEDSLARALYHRAQILDGEDWPEGTSVIAGAKATVEAGFIRQYRWAFSTGELRVAVLTHGPAVLGIPWLDGMWDTDENGMFHAVGSVAGGHAILCNGFHPSRGFHLHNSWGGQANGWISEPDLGRLLMMDGEACIPVGRSYNRKKAT